MLTQIATQFLDSLTPQEQMVIKDEISKSVDAMPEDQLYATPQSDRQDTQDNHQVALEGAKKNNQQIGKEKSNFKK